jgi:hypothetical protein
MQREEVRRIVIAQFYESLAASGVEVTAIPQVQMQAIVGALADGLIAALAALEDEETRLATAAPRAIASGPATAAATEMLLWSGRPYLSIGIRYEVTSQRLRVIRGLIGRDLEEIELVQVRDIDASQNVGERMLNIGDVRIISNDPTRSEIVLSNIHDPLGVREIIRKAVMAEKQRLGFHYQEEM